MFESVLVMWLCEGSSPPPMLNLAMFMRRPVSPKKSSAVFSASSSEYPTRLAHQQSDVPHPSNTPLLISYLLFGERDTTVAAFTSFSLNVRYPAIVPHSPAAVINDTILLKTFITYAPYLFNSIFTDIPENVRHPILIIILTHKPAKIK